MSDAPPPPEPVPLDGYVLEDQVGHLLRRAHQRATGIFLATIGAVQVTPTQWAALVKLHERGELSQNHLGRLTAMDPATIQGVSRRLEARGLIRRSTDPEDRRRTVLAVTEEGAAVVASGLDAARRISADTLAPLPPREQRVFLDLLRRLS